MLQDGLIKLEMITQFVRKWLFGKNREEKIIKGICKSKTEGKRLRETQSKGLKFLKKY